MKCLGSYLAPRGSGQEDDDAHALGGADTALKATTHQTRDSASFLAELTDHGLPTQTTRALPRYLIMGAPVHTIRNAIPNQTLINEYDTVTKEAWEKNS